MNGQSISALPKKTGVCKLNLLNSHSKNLEHLQSHEINYEDIDYTESVGYQSVNYQNIVEDGFTVQGMTTTNNQLIIAAYTKKKDENGKTLNSRLYVYNMETDTFEGTFTLDNNAHVGGVSYDKENGILYVTGSNGQVNAYDYDKMQQAIYDVNSEEEFDIRFEDFLNVNGKSRSAFIIDVENMNKSLINISIEDYGDAATTYYYDGHLYTATFEGSKNGIMICQTLNVEIDESGNKKIIIDEKETKKYDIPKQIQGVAFTDYNGKRYMLLSQSIGIAKSNLMVYEYDEMTDKFNFLGKTYECHGMEGISVNENGEVMAVFEDSAPGMLNLDPKNESLVTNMEDLLNNISTKNNLWEEGMANLGGIWYDKPW